jgi:4-hydroxybenzoate polyprenyltransferase
VPRFAWLLLLANSFWVLAYDTEYAMVDRDDDVRIGIRTSALAFGRYDVVAVAVCYALYIAGMVARRLGAWRRLFRRLSRRGCIAAWHVWLIRDRSREQCFRAFLHNHWLGFTIFVPSRWTSPCALTTGRASGDAPSALALAASATLRAAAGLRMRRHLSARCSS